MSAYLKLAVLIAVVAIAPAAALYLLVPASDEAAWRVIRLAALIAYPVSVALLILNRRSRLKAGKADGP